MVDLFLFPECLFTFPCQWNYRPDHCMYGSNCKGAEEEGVSILHGNRGVYHDDKQPAFKAVYDAIHDVSESLMYFIINTAPPHVVYILYSIYTIHMLYIHIRMLYIHICCVQTTMPHSRCTKAGNL